MSKRSCIVPNCLPEDRKANSVTYFRIPSDPSRCKQWLLNSNRKDLLKHNPRDLSVGQFFICSNHFTGGNISKTKPKRLFPHSVPTVFPKCSGQVSSVETSTNTGNPDEDCLLVPPFKRIRLGKPYSANEDVILEVNKTPNQKSYMSKSPTVLNSMQKIIVQGSPTKHSPRILCKTQPKEILKQIQGPSNTTIEVVKIPEQKTAASQAPPKNISTPVQSVNLNNSQNNFIQFVDITGKSQPTLIQISGNHDGKITPQLIKQITQAMNSGSLQTPQKIVSPVKPVEPPTFTLTTTPIRKKILPKEAVARSTLTVNSGLLQTTQKIVTPVKPLDPSTFTLATTPNPRKILPKESVARSNSTLNSGSLQTAQKIVTTVKPVDASTFTLETTPTPKKIVTMEPGTNLALNLNTGSLQPMQKIVSPVKPVDPLSNLLLVVTPSKKIVTNKPVASIDLTDITDEESIKQCKVSQCKQTKPKCHFPVPQEEFALELWRTCLSDWKLAQGDWVCDEHFLDTDIFQVGSTKEQFLIKKHALPAISKSELYPTCLVPFCKNQRYITCGENLYPIPFWERLLGNWIKVVYHLKDSEKGTLMKYRICSRHFSNLHSADLFVLMPDKYLPPDMYETVLREWKEKGATNDIIIDDNICAFWKCKAEAMNRLMQFTKFPADFELCQVWLTICKRGDVLLKPVYEIEKFVRKSKGVCFVHHQEITRNMDTFKHLFYDNHGKRKFDGKAVGMAPGYTIQMPTVPTEKPKVSVPPPGAATIYVPSKEYCSYVNCSTHIRTQFIRKYKFPIDKDLLQAWSDAAGIDPNVPMTYNCLFICGKHFRLDQYTERGTLKRNSVPVNHIEYIDPKANTSNPQWLKKQWQTKKKQVVQQSPRVNVASVPNTSNNTRSVVTIESNSVSSPALGQQTRKSCPGCDGTGLVFTLNKLAGNNSTAYCTTCRGSGELGNTIPLITLTGPGSTPSQNSMPSRFPSNQEVMELFGDKCCIKHCSSSASTHQLHGFPPITENRRFLLWVKAATNSASVKHQAASMHITFKKKQICEKHFEEKYYCYLNGQRKLRGHAVPTLDLVSADEDLEVVEDKEIKWESIVTNEVDASKAFVKGRAILRENSIEFPTIERSLTFGTGCPKKGLNRFPYKVYSLPRSDSVPSKEFVAAGHPFQIHTAVVIDDDSDAEAETVDMIYEVMKENDFPKYNTIKTELKMK